MTNDDHKSRNQNNKPVGTLTENILLAALVIGGFGITVGTGAMIDHNNKVHRRLEHAARTLSLEHYVPVGNGGALAEMHGQITPQRRGMYDSIETTFFMKLYGQAPIRTFAEYDLKTKTDLTEQERQDLKDIVDRYNPHLLR